MTDRLISCKLVKNGYECLKEYTYHSPRYNRKVTVKKGFISDGATGVRDLMSNSWWVHDVLCKRKTWDDGTKASQWQASMVLHDILYAEGYKKESFFWCLGTFVYGIFFNPF